jgi:hypothetical protein
LQGSGRALACKRLSMTFNCSAKSTMEGRVTGQLNIAAPQSFGLLITSI